MNGYRMKIKKQRSKKTIEQKDERMRKQQIVTVGKKWNI